MTSNSSKYQHSYQNFYEQFNQGESIQTSNFMSKRDQKNSKALRKDFALTCIYSKKKSRSDQLKLLLRQPIPHPPPPKKDGRLEKNGFKIVAINLCMQCCRDSLQFLDYIDKQKLGCSNVQIVNNLDCSRTSHPLANSHS